MPAAIVFVPAEFSGNYDYQVDAASAFDAARKAIAEHESRRGPLDDDVIVRVVVGGKNPLLFDYDVHNAAQPNYRVRVGRVR